MYQQLEGGRGRSIYFRAPRIKASLFLKGEILVAALGERFGRVRDLSSDGLLCDLPVLEHAPRVGAALPVQLRVRDHPLFDAAAEIVRVESIRGFSRVAVRFVDALLDPNLVRVRARDAVFRDEFEAGPSIYEPVPTRYRLAINQAVLVVSHWRDLLDRREREIIDGRPGSAQSELEELQEIADKRVRIDWERVHADSCEAANDAAFASDRLSSAKRFTETLLTPLLMRSPIWKQAYLKPRGYPGDFELMNMMYESERRGASVFDRVMHQLGREERLAATVRSRKDFLVSELSKELARHDSPGASLRIANIGAGPAREVEEFLVSCTIGAGKKLQISLIDQDHGALEYAHDRLRRASLRHGGRVELRCRFVSFKDLLVDSALAEEVRDQDLIYTAGFFDYLPDPVASALLLRLSVLLRKSGRLLVGNAVNAPEVKWVPEFVLDWPMVYRKPSDMRAMAQPIADGCTVDVAFDRSGAWQFLLAQRRR